MLLVLRCLAASLSVLEVESCVVGPLMSGGILKCV